jgi:hypothetical protein
MMGAGNAGASQYKANVNLNSGGGSKKQGVTSRVGLDNWANLAIQTYSNGYGRNKLFVMNQLGGVGAGQSMFNGRFTQVDGVHSQMDIDASIERLKYLLSLYYTEPSDPYELALFGDRESVRDDLINSGYEAEANQSYDKVIQFDEDYVLPSMPYRVEILILITGLNWLIKKQIPYSTRFGTHTLALVPRQTGIVLQNARYGLTMWNDLRIYYMKDLPPDYTVDVNL